jgi:RNA polymerase sigma-70 factor (ECF subfamily)
MTAERSDEDLMLAYAGGEEAAFRTLFARYAPQLVRVLRRQVGREADAQDLAQQTFLQLHRARHDFKPGTRLRPWVITIALNLARDHLRRRGRRPEAPLDDRVPEPSVEPAIPDGGDAETAQRVRRALGTLPRDQREVIELHWFEQLSFAEIATVVGSTSGAVRVRAHRGYVTLRKSLGSVSGMPPGEAA